ncbi:hypothetical protein FB451DRAFT_1364382 [Mycena latifolia]|nr:hypothetical protein FB451DRAFT_1364382 [Mycena latifolia]
MPVSRSRCSECGAFISAELSEGGPLDSNINVATRTLVRHQELLSTNAAPEGPELAFVHSVVSNTGARLADVENEISRLQARLQQLEEERAKLSSYYARNNAILSPLRRMPPEVLGEIFSWTLPPDRHGFERLKFNTNSSPWLLAQISSRWRAVALSTPSLWSSIVINYTDQHSNPLSRVKTQIERAHKLPIYFYGTEKWMSQPQIEMFSCLAEHSARWDGLFIELTSDLVPLLASLRDRVPSLRRLGIQWDVPDSQAGVESIDCFQTAPSLSNVDIYNEFGYVSIPAHQLTRYKLDSPWDVHTSILKLAYNLVEVRIDISFDDADWPEQHIMDLACLRRLYVSDTGILNYLRTPALREVMMHVSVDEQWIHPLEAFLARSSCTLQRLSLRGWPRTPATAEVLRKVPAIVELVILIDELDAGEEVNRLIFHLTIRDPNEMPVAPQLRGLFFGCEDESYIDYGLYLRMLQSRWKADGYALEAAALLWESAQGPAPAILSGLDALRQDGLDLLLLGGEEVKERVRDMTDRWKIWGWYS